MFIARQNIVREKSYLFSLRIIKLHLHLREKKEYHLSAQLVRAGTSIGANIEESQGGSSRRDFKAKLDIAHKEAKETFYWIRLLKDGHMIEERLANSFLEECEELIRLLTSILNTVKSNPEPSDPTA